MTLENKPYNSEHSKKEEIEMMFDHISPTYDFLNRVFSFGIDQYWRKVLISKLDSSLPIYVLDVATGTADVAIQVAKKYPKSFITGIDLSNKMIDIGNQKIQKQELYNQIELQQGDSESLSFEDDTFDAVVVAFGLRNFEELNTGLSEIFRVLKKGGQFFILECSEPKNKLIKLFYYIYFHKLTPFFGRHFSKDLSAYQYLSESVAAFPSRAELSDKMMESGFRNCRFKSLTFGVVSIYEGIK